MHSKQPNSTANIDGTAVSTKSRLAVLSLAVGSFASVTAEFLPVGVLPQVATTFGVSEGSAGLMMTLPGALAALAAPGVMIMSGSADRRRVLLLLSSVLVLACLLSAWAPTFWVMLLGRALVGISLGAFWAMALSVAVKLVPPEKGHQAAAAVFAGVTAAMILGVPLGTLIADYFSWRSAFIATAFIAVTALVFQAIALIPVPADGPLKFSSLVAFTRKPQARKSMMMITLIFSAHFGTYTFVTPLMQRAGIDPSQITLILLGYGVAGFLSNFIATKFVADNLKATLLTAKLLLLGSIAILPLISGLPGIDIVLVLLWGGAWGALPLSLNMWHRHASTGNGDASSAVFTSTGQVAIALGSGAGGLIMDNAGVSTVFLSGAAVVLLSVLVLVTYRPGLQPSRV